MKKYFTLLFFYSCTAFAQSPPETSLSVSFAGTQLKQYYNSLLHCLGCGELDVIYFKGFSNESSVLLNQVFVPQKIISIIFSEGLSFTGGSFDYSTTEGGKVVWNGTTLEANSFYDTGRVSLRNFYLKTSIGVRANLFKHRWYLQGCVQPQILLFNNSINNHTRYKDYSVQIDSANWEHTNTYYTYSEKEKMAPARFNLLIGAGHSFQIKNHKCQVELNLLNGSSLMNKFESDFIVMPVSLQLVAGINLKK